MQHRLRLWGRMLKLQRCPFSLAPSHLLLFVLLNDVCIELRLFHCSACIYIFSWNLIIYCLISGSGPGQEKRAAFAW